MAQITQADGTCIWARGVRVGACCLCEICMRLRTRHPPSLRKKIESVWSPWAMMVLFFSYRRDVIT